MARYKGKRFSESEKYENISENAMYEEDTRVKRKKKMSKGKKIALIIIILLLIAVVGVGIFAGVFVASKFSKITYKQLDESDLDINNNLFEDVEGVSKSQYDNITNILFLGSDSRDMKDAYEGNSDAIMIISINPNNKSIKLISIPRDTAANIEGMENRYKINAAFNMGKEQLAVKTVNKTFDLNLKEYVSINISGLYDVINKIGGLELNITQDEMKYINQYIDMFYKFSGKPVQRVQKYGKVKLTGEQVAAHVKERMAGSQAKGETHGDYGRTKRQREVIQALINTISKKDAGEISDIVDMVLSEVTTNVDAGKIASLLLEYTTNKDKYSSNMTSVMLPGLDYSEEIMEDGAYLYVTKDIERAKKEFIHYMYEI